MKAISVKAFTPAKRIFLQYGLRHLFKTMDKLSQKQAYLLDINIFCLYLANKNKLIRIL